MTRDVDMRRLFEPLWDDHKRLSAENARPRRLAHYTTIKALESIVTTDQLWFSHPVLMNDYEELFGGLKPCAAAFAESGEIRNACGSEARHRMVRDAFNAYWDEFVSTKMHDIYVFCFSEHLPEDVDGLLSMWRGYGANGEGAAIIFDSSRFGSVDDSFPLILDKVCYRTNDLRQTWIRERVSQYAHLLLEASLPDELLGQSVAQFFERIKMFSLFTKHVGFKEEKEWRVAYMRERDSSNIFSGMCGFNIGVQAEPKFKLDLKLIENLRDWRLETIVSEIILGPGAKSDYSKLAVRRMLESKGKRQLSDAVSASSIPYRATVGRGL